ncbi:MAG TPA: mechanosensitive ion channel family protein [Candidatus Saccharimonadales bacterium]|nr:mechanosensitive ion channel family protein [Candidatus Saccharimonadales bacterium]
MDMVQKWIADNGVDALIIILVTTLFYIAGNFLVGRVVRRAVRVQGRGREWHRKDIEKREKTLVGPFMVIWRVVIITIAAFVFIKALLPSTDLAPLFASAGIIGVALGFGAQSLVKDFLSGIFIISENQYRVGDIIDIEGASGTVERIGSRSTVLRDADGNVHYFPNGMVQHVINKTMGYSMARFSITVAPSADLEHVIELINLAGEKLASEEKWQPKIIEAPSFVSVGEFTSTTVSLLISGKTQPSDQWSVAAEMRRRLLETFEKKGIELGTTLPAAPPRK